MEGGHRSVDVKNAGRDGQNLVEERKYIFSSNRPEAFRKECNRIQMNISYSLEKVLLCKDLVIILTYGCEINTY